MSMKQRLSLTLETDGEWVETWDIYVDDRGMIRFADARQAIENAQDMIHRGNHTTKKTLDKTPLGA
jgi:hypothetical protein